MCAYRSFQQRDRRLREGEGEEELAVQQQKEASFDLHITGECEES